MLLVAALTRPVSIHKLVPECRLWLWQNFPVPAMDAKVGNRLLKAVLADGEIGSKVARLAKDAVPGCAKFAALTKEQRTWIWNNLKNKYWKQLPSEDRQYYKDLAPDAACAVRSKSLLLEVMGGSSASSSSAQEALPQRIPAIPQRAPKEGSSTQPARQKRGKRTSFGRSRDAVKTVASALRRFSGSHRPTLCKLIRNVVGRLNEDIPGVRRELKQLTPFRFNSSLFFAC